MVMATYKLQYLSKYHLQIMFVFAHCYFHNLKTSAHAITMQGTLAFYIKWGCFFVNALCVARFFWCKSCWETPHGTSVIILGYPGVIPLASEINPGYPRMIRYAMFPLPIRSTWSNPIKQSRMLMFARVLVWLGRYEWLGRSTLVGITRASYPNIFVMSKRSD